MPRKSGVSAPYSRPLEIVGSEGMIANLYGSNRRIKQAVVKRNHKTGAKMRDRAKYYCPVDRGYLQESIEYYLSPGGQVFTVHCNPETFANISTGPEEPYDIWVEFGTSVSPAQPFMTPAYREIHPEHVAGMATDIGKAIQAKP